MRPFLSDVMHLTELVAGAALVVAVGTRLVFRRGKSLEEP